MPEGPEIETENLHETIKEELEHDGGSFLKRIALTTAILAACAAVAALRAGATVNEALVLKTEATRLQAEASDQWAYYQAKGLKAAVQEASAASWLAIGKEATIGVDSYPGRAFRGRVSRIASRAEFTPKNVQTKDERVKQVFAVTVDLGDGEGALRPGMPADARLGAR